MNGKPPLAVSPRRLRPRRPPISLPSLQTSTMKTKSKPPSLLPPTRHSIAGEPRKDCLIFSSELVNLTKQAKDDFTSSNDPINCANPPFKRGRFYDLYSARRNERLKRKMMGISNETVALYPEAAVEPAKKRAFKQAETPRKSCPGNFSVSRASLRSSTVRSSYKKMTNVSASGISAIASSVNVGQKMMTRSAMRKAI